jgi:hypothetical protein
VLLLPPSEGLQKGVSMKNPLESLHMTIVMGLLLTVVMIVIVRLIS